jgi:two-component system chemotaxis sensor kinase CheA
VRAGIGKARTGTLTLRAFHEGGQVNIEISDDGRGLAVENIRRKAVERGLVPADRASRLTDREVSQLVFLPGFSTAAKVTNVSGRGVGMDVVKSNIERIGGTVDLVSPPGGGTKIKIKIPLTLAIVPALTVVSAGQRYAIPQVNLLELVRLDGEQARASIENVYGKPVYRLRGRLLPLVFLNEQFKRRVQTAGNDEAVNIVVLQADDRQFGLIVDEVRDTEEIVVKPLGKELKGLSVFAGATVMGDGRVALILDVIGLAQLAGAMGRDRDRSPVVTARTTQTATDGGQDTEKQTLLLFGVGDDTTMAVPLSAVARLEEFPTARLERAGGKLVVQYRNELLPLVEVAAAVGKSGWKPNDTVHVIVYSAGGQSVGFVVTKILDVVNGTLKVERATRRPGLLGATILQDRVTELLDVEGLVRSHYPSFYERDVA